MITVQHVVTVLRVFTLARRLQPHRSGVELSERELKVLLVDADLERARIVEADLGAAGATSIVRLRAGELLLDAVSRERPHVVIVDMARPDRDSLDDIRHIARHDPRPIVMFVDRDDPAFMEAAIDAGVSSYNVVGAALPDVKPIVQAAVAMFRRYRQVEFELRKAEASLKQRALIERAKSLLMRQRNIGEPEAYRWLRRQAMDRGKKIADIAGEIIANAEAQTKAKPQAKLDLQDKAPEGGQYDG
jgi:two-component system, response regulator / RNA-binding antiterminator